MEFPYRRRHPIRGVPLALPAHDSVRLQTLGPRIEKNRHFLIVRDINKSSLIRVRKLCPLEGGRDRHLCAQPVFFLPLEYLVKLLMRELAGSRLPDAY